MNHPSTSMQTRIRGEQRGERDTRLHGRQLVLARALWGIIAIFELAALVDSLTGTVTQLQVLCTSSCTIQQLSAAAVSTLEHVGLSLGDYIAFYLVVILISTLLCYAIAALLLWRRSDDWMALLVSLMLMSFGPGTISNAVRFSQWFGPAVAPHVSSLFDASNLTILVLVVVPRFTAPEFLIGIYDYLFVGILLSLIIAQVYRYRRVSTHMQRQQTKWVVYSLVVSVTSVVGLLVIFQPEPGSLLSALDIIANLLLTLIPISFAVAIQRYRLYDIDILINRTLVYVILTALLALIYVGLIIALQSLLRSIINQNSDVAIVVSTLAIAALFQPLRRRIQRIIDRRFYRRKYDAAKTLAAFSAVVRNEVDLDDLSRHLMAVVEETMQPAHVSLWLRKSGRERKTTTEV